MELIDALASKTNAHSVVELSLSSLFRRSYNSVYDAIEQFFVPSKPETAEQERREQERGLLSLLEPFQIIGKGLTVGFIVKAMFMPQNKLMETLGG